MVRSRRSLLVLLVSFGLASTAHAEPPRNTLSANPVRFALLQHE